jgi:hypothetical protein
MKELAFSLLPFGLAELVRRLRNRDANATGADDVSADVVQALTPVLPALIDGTAKDDKAMLVAMRTIEQVAHNYRVQMKDPTLQQQ